MRSVVILFFILILGCSEEQRVNESIVYLKSADGNFDLYQSDILGQWERRLTTNPGWDWSGRWNTGREQLIYYSNDTLGNFSVLAMKGFSERIDTLPFSDLLNYQLTTDGQSILYTVKDSLSSSIALMSLADSSQNEVITNSTGYNGRFNMSEDGQLIAFISDRDGSNQLYLLNILSKEITQLTEGPLIAKYNSFSPDGSQIAVTLAEPSDDPVWDIYIVDIKTLKTSRLTKTPYSEQEIAWSPLGKKIAFHGTSEADGDQIYTIDIADGKFTKITSGDFYHGEPAWLPFEY